MIRKRVVLFGSGLLLMAVGYWVPRLYTVAVTAVGSMSAAQWSLRCSAPNAKVTPGHRPRLLGGALYLDVGMAGGRGRCRPLSLRGRDSPAKTRTGASTVIGREDDGSRFRERSAVAGRSGRTEPARPPDQDRCS